MKILHFLVTNKLSGAENVHLGILEALSGKNQVYYVCPEGPIREFAERAGVNFVAADTDNISEIKRVYREIAPDIVHACDPRMSFKCALAGIPFIAHFHNNCPWMKKFSPNSLALLYTIKRAKAVITVSDSIEREYIFRKALKGKLHMLSNVVDSEKVIQMSKEPFDKNFDIVFVGRLNEQKRPLLFLDFVKKLTEKLPSLTAVMVGEGEMADDVKAYISENKLNNVTLWGFEKNPYKIINSSKINVFTSYYEGFGLVAVESMILGKPVIGYPVGGLAKVITPDSGFLCRNTEEMAENAYRLLTDEVLYEKLSVGAAENAKRFTDTAEYMGKIREIYLASLETDADPADLTGD